jgi:hypothetical protein
MLHGGLSDEDWKVITALCSFDYMGAAEFEFGALPEGFRKIAKATDLEAFTIDVSGSPHLHWEMEKKYSYQDLAKVGRRQKLNATIFVLAPQKFRPAVVQTISVAAHGEDERLKEPTRLRSTVLCSWRWTGYESEAKWQRRTIQGWVELDNGFMFFASEAMWRNFCKLFNVEVPSRIEVRQPDFARVESALAKCNKRESAVV